MEERIGPVNFYLYKTEQTNVVAIIWYMNFRNSKVEMPVTKLSVPLK